MGLISRMRALVKGKPTASPPPEPRWLCIWQTGCPMLRAPFVHQDQDLEDAWEDVLELTFDGYRADRIGDCVYLTGEPNGFEGRAQ